MIGRKDDPAFLYFPDNYRWSMGLLICLSGAPWVGVEIDEVHRVGRALEDRVGDDQAWFEEWTRMGDKIEARGREEERKGHRHTAASCFRRASRYYQTGERFVHPRSQRSMDVYAKSVQLFKDAAAVIRHPRIEPVEVPYDGASLPALLVHPDPAAAGGKPAPAMVFFDGFDVTKELQYGYGVPDLAARGVGCLIVDGPGNGESVRFRNLPLIAETERYASAAYEYLASRREFDARRIGVMALSLGGYYAPRAAALEPRFACCVAWGAQWDYHAIWAKRLEQLASGQVLSLSVPPEHLQWVLGVSSNAAALKKLEGFRLDGIVQKMSCPFLLLHGAGDEQIPLSLAEKCFAAVGSKQKTLRVFQREEGGFHHCQVDNVTIGVHAMWDWIEDVLATRANSEWRIENRGNSPQIFPIRCSLLAIRPRGSRMNAAPIYITEAEVARLVTVKDAIATLDELFATWGQPSTWNIPRRRAPLPGGAFNLMGAAYGAKNVYGLKAYAGMKGGQFHTLLYSSTDGKLKAVIEADLFGQLRTGAASGLATRLLANPDARTLGMIGVGRQSRTQAIAVCAVRPIKRVLVFARTAESREAYARTLEKELGVEVRAAALGRGLRERGERRGHHHQVGRAGVSRRVADQGHSRQCRGRQFRRPPRGRRRDSAALRDQGDRPCRASHVGSGRVPRPRRRQQAEMVRRPRARRVGHGQPAGAQVVVRHYALQVARHRARGRGLRRAGLSARARRRCRTMPIWRSCMNA